METGRSFRCGTWWTMRRLLADNDLQTSGDVDASVQTMMTHLGHCTFAGIVGSSESRVVVLAGDLDVIVEGKTRGTRRKMKLGGVDL